MLTSLTRRVALVSVASGLVVATVATGSAPVGAAPDHGAAPAKAKITAASLTAVSVAPHSSTAWAYGSQSTAKAVGDPYALRRTGSHWKKDSIKIPKDSTLFGIAAGSPKSAWIVGDTLKGVSTHTLVEHSTGGGFKPFKTTLGVGQLTAVSASSASNVWAVGDGRQTADGAYIAHWNGKTWKALPGTKLVGDTFNLVSASSPSNVWFLGNNTTTGTIIGVWNGHKLTVTPFTPPSSVSSISTTSAKNTWAVGTRSIGTSGHSGLFTEHWNGKSWKVVKTPAPGFVVFGPVISAAGSRVSIGGTFYPKSELSSSAFALRYAGGKWKSAPTASPGRQSGISSLSLSTKGGAAVGTWSVRGQCGVKHPTPNLPFAESLNGTSWHENSAAKLRFGSAHLRLPAARPNIPAC